MNPYNPFEVGAHRTLLARTCVRCGEFRQGNEFDFFYSKHKGCKRSTLTRQAWCRPCLREWVNKRNIEKNHESWDKATNARQLWTKAELDHLYMLHNVDYSWSVISEVLGRSLSAVTSAYNKYFVNGVYEEMYE